MNGHTHLDTPEIEASTNYDDLWELLLLADPSEVLVRAYLKDGKVFVARVSGVVVGVYVLLQLSDVEYEIKNIAVAPQYQNRGLGLLMLSHAKGLLSHGANVELKICTGNTSIQQIALYKKAGFQIVSVQKDFFVDNYAQAIFENGQRCKDLVVMSQRLG